LVTLRDDAARVRDKSLISLTLIEATALIRVGLGNLVRTSAQFFTPL